MAQPRWMSLSEAVTGTVVGYGIALTAQVYIFPAYNVMISLQDSAQIALIFLLISLVRSYIWRRLWDRLQSWIERRWRDA